MNSMDRVSGYNSTISNMIDRLDGGSSVNPANSNESDPAMMNQNIKITREKLQSSVEAVNKMMESVPERLTFKVHEKSGQVMMQIIDQQGNVLKEVPPKEWLDFVGRLREMVGLFVDKRQ